MLSSANIRHVRALALVPALQFLVGCTVGPTEIPVVDPLPVIGPAATVSVVRRKQFCGSYPLNFIVVDGRAIAALAAGEHTSFEVSPGRHTIAILHHVINGPLIIGGGPAAVLAGVSSGEYGVPVTEELVAGATNRFVLRSRCIPLDENDRVMINRVDEWPDDAAPDPKSFVPAGGKGVGEGAP